MCVSKCVDDVVAATGRQSLSPSIPVSSNLVTHTRPDQLGGFDWDRKGGGRVEGRMAQWVVTRTDIGTSRY